LAPKEVTSTTEAGSCAREASWRPLGREGPLKEAAREERPLGEAEQGCSASRERRRSSSCRRW
jgi:hypothetical protein